MNHCSSCNALLKEGAKFCTNCGSMIKEVEQPQKAYTGLTELIVHKSKSRFRGTKIFIGLFTVIALFFIVRSLVTDIDISRNSMSVSNALSKIEGDWYDPTGVLLGDNEAIITFRKRGDAIIGEDKNKTIYIQLLPVSNKKYNGLVVLNGVDGGFDALLDEEEDKLVFINTITKSSWNIIKVK